MIPANPDWHDRAHSSHFGILCVFVQYIHTPLALLCKLTSEVLRYLPTIGSSRFWLKRKQARNSTKRFLSLASSQRKEQCFWVLRMAAWTV
jgi:hypothetical protein